MCFSLRVNIGEAVFGGARLALGLASCACPSSWPSVGRPSAVAVFVDFFSPIINRDLFITPMIDRFFLSLIPKISQTSGAGLRIVFAEPLKITHIMASAMKGIGRQGERAPLGSYTTSTLGTSYAQPS